MYDHRGISYRTFDRDATEVLRLTFRPRSVTAGGHTFPRRATGHGDSYTLESIDGRSFVVRVRHLHSGEVRIAR